MNFKGFFGNWIVKNILLAILLAAVLVAGASFFLNAVTKHNKELRVPDLTNMSVIEAKSIASMHGMRTEVTDSVYIKRMERGSVYRQNPTAGSKVKNGRRISLTINALHSKRVTMPNLTGYSTRQAKAELLSRGLTLGNLIYVEDIATNNVLKQLHKGREIAPGAQIESESKIDLVIGLNRIDNITYIPDVIGLKYLNAVDAIHNSSLNVRKLIFDRTVKDYTDSLNAIVYKQDPAASADTSFIMGSEVNLYLTTDKNRIPVTAE